jgi:hypothetical protein
MEPMSSTGDLTIDVNTGLDESRIRSGHREL